MSCQRWAVPWHRESKTVHGKHRFNIPNGKIRISLTPHLHAINFLKIVNSVLKNLFSSLILLKERLKIISADIIFISGCLPIDGSGWQQCNYPVSIFGQRTSILSSCLRICQGTGKNCAGSAALTAPCVPAPVR